MCFQEGVERCGLIPEKGGSAPVGQFMTTNSAFYLVLLERVMDLLFVPGLANKNERRPNSRGLVPLLPLLPRLLCFAHKASFVGKTRLKCFILREYS